MSKISEKYRALLIYLALALATLAGYWQVRNCQFVKYDDEQYVTENWHVKTGLTGEGALWAFTTGHASNWHPLTWLSHMLDCHLFGTNPRWHHLTNLLLHIANTLLLFAVLKQMTAALWRSAFVAAAFALHPLHVESVAWIAERKDVLSTLFWMLTMIAYLNYVRHSGVIRYLLTLLVFALGLMAKPMLVTLPFVLLLLDYWPLGRLELGRDVGNKTRLRLVWEKIPFFVLSAASSVITFLVQQKGGAVSKLDMIPLIIRFGNAFISYVRYIGKMFWPDRMAVLYPYPVDMALLWPAVSALVLLAVSVLVIRLAPKYKYLLVGWLWYLGTLFPVIGLVQVGSQAFADRYTYIPLIGLFIIVGWGLPDLLSKRQYRKITLALSAGIVFTAMFVCTRLQVSHWQNSFTLFGHALDVTENNNTMHTNYGSVLLDKGLYEQAIEYFNESLRLNPENYLAHNNMGVVFLEQDRFDEAIMWFNRAVQLDPNRFEAHGNLGSTFLKQGKLDQAVTHYTEALRVGPDVPRLHKSLGDVFLVQGRLEEAVTEYQNALQMLPDDTAIINDMGVALGRQDKLYEAISYFNRALAIRPDFPDAHCNLGYALMKQGNLDEAVAHLTEALRIDPNYADAHNHLGYAYLQQGDSDRAITHLTEAVRFDPNYTDAHNNLGYAFFQYGDFDRAVTHFTKALRIDPNYADAHNNLGIVLAAQGKPDEAVGCYHRALQIDPNFAEAHYNLARLLAEENKINEAVTHLKETLRIRPDWLDPTNNLAWFLATHKDSEFYDPQEAVRLAYRACELGGYNQPNLLDTLAAAYAAAGRFSEAIATAERALALAQSSQQKELIEQIQNRLDLYKASRAYIEKPSNQNTSAP